MPSRSLCALVPVPLLFFAVVIGCEDSLDADAGCPTDPPDVMAGTGCAPVYLCIDGEWTDVRGPCPEPPCPPTKPADGSACERVDQTCYYDAYVGCEGEEELQKVPALCTSNGWWSAYHYCVDTTECPDELPVLGTSCIAGEYGGSCAYSVHLACGKELVSLYCSYRDDGSIWTLISGLTCDQCSLIGAEAECALTTECQWLTPGCGDLATQTGCYSKVGCDVTGCTDDSVCAETTYDPCHGEGALCDACGASFFACLPAQVP